MTEDAVHEEQAEEFHSAAVETASAATAAHHDSATHMDAHTALSDDDHGHGEEPLGPIDWGAWSVALLSGAMALVVVALFWVAVS